MGYSEIYSDSQWVSSHFTKKNTSSILPRTFDLGCRFSSWSIMKPVHHYTSSSEYVKSPIYTYHASSSPT